MKTNVTLFIISLSIAGLVAGCNIFSPGQSGRCEGSLTLEHPIPDTTVAVGDTLFIDLANPPVFESSKGRVSYFPVLQSGYLNVDVRRVDNPQDKGRLSVIRISGKKVGEAILELEVSSGCLENSTTFNITIKEQ